MDKDLSAESPECYGKRLDSYDKCEECDDIVACSIITLESITNDNVRIIPP